MNWLHKQVSLYGSRLDTVGTPISLRDILFTHSWEDIDILCELRKLEPDQKKYGDELKAKLKLFSPSALMKSRAAGAIEIIHHTGLMQLDFDYSAIHEYDIEELKECVFALPFVALCSLSCSGRGFYALVSISEPERQKEYAEHCFRVFEGYGIKPDKSKGRNPQDLRFLSYDANMLLRENPEPLLLPQRKPIQPLKFKGNGFTQSNYRRPGIDRQIDKIHSAVIGERWPTIQQVAFTLGGYNQPDLIHSIIEAINLNPEFRGKERKYIECAIKCFEDGQLKPFTQ